MTDQHSDPHASASSSSPTSGGLRSDEAGAGAALGPGVQLNGVYEIDAHLAAGGMGEVFKAHSIQTGDMIAIKAIHSKFVENETAIALFRKEAASLSRLHHEAIVRYFLFSIDPVTQRAYVAMEFVEGEVLTKILQKGPIRIEDICLLGRRLALGLHAAHEQRIIHGDIAPDNIIVPDGDMQKAKIIDFGIARSTEPESGTVVEIGFAGKYRYAAPEALGLYDGLITPKSDVYSLGLVLLEAATGCKPDSDAPSGELRKRRNALPDLSKIDPRLAALLKDMLAPDPANRLGSMLAVATRVENLLTPRRRLPTASLLRTCLGAVLVFGSAAAAYYLWPTRSTPARLSDGADHNPPPTPNAPASQSAAAVATPISIQDRIFRFLNEYPRGPCFSISSLRVGEDGATELEGIASSREPFDKLDQAFKTAMGREALIRGRLIKPAQCPVLAFVNQFQGDLQQALMLTFSTTVLHGGRPLTGVFANKQHAHTLALLTSGGGETHVVSGDFSANSDGSFLSLVEQPKNPPEPLLLTIVVSAEPINFPAPSSDLDGATLFQKLQADLSSRREKPQAELHYFRVE